MADQEVTIQITPEVDDSNLKELESTIQELEAKGFTINFDTSDDAESIEELKQKIEELEQALESIDPSPLEETGDAGKNAGDGIDSATESINGTTAGAGALAGIGIGAFFMEAADTAGNASDSLKAINLNLQDAGASAGTIKNIGTNVSDAANATGRSAGKVRTAFQSWTATGVTAGDTMEKLFEIGSATAFKNPRISIEGFTQALQMSIQKGTLNDRVLMNMGTSINELSRKTCKSKEELNAMYSAMTPNERATFLSQYAGDLSKSKKANEEFKKSWEGTKEAITKSVGSILRAVGEVMIPTLVPALQGTADVLSQVAQGFKWLNSVTGGAAGGVVSIVGGLFVFSSLAPGVKLVFDNFKNGITILKELPANISGAFTTMQNTLTGFGGKISNFRSIVSHHMTNIGSSAINAGYKISDAFKTAGNKIGDFTTNTGNRIKTFASTVGNGLSSAGSKIGGFVNNAGSKLKDLGSAFANSGKQALIAAGNYVKSGLAAAANAVRTGIMTAATWLATAAQTALNFVMAINPIFLVIMAVAALVAALVYLYYNNETVRNGINALGAGLKFVAGLIYNSLIVAWNRLVSTFLIVQTAIRTFVSVGISFISQLPGRIGAFLSMVINRVASWGSSIVARGRSSILNFVNSIVNNAKTLPQKFISALGSLKDMIWNFFKDLATNAWNSFWNQFNANKDASGGSPWEVTHNNGSPAGNPFEENINTTSRKNNITIHFNGLITERETANYIIDTIEKHNNREATRIGA